MDFLSCFESERAELTTHDIHFGGGTMPLLCESVTSSPRSPTDSVYSESDTHSIRSLSGSSGTSSGSSAQLDLLRQDLPELLAQADLKRKRLDRKAELARLSRKRKQSRIEELESEVEQLKSELQHERSKTAELETVVLKRTATAVDWDERLKSKFQKFSGTAATATAASVQDFVDAHKSKNGANEIQIAPFEIGLGSDVTYNFLRWVLNQKNNFYNDPTGLWRSLFEKNLQCTPQQLSQLEELRHALRPKLQQWNDLEASLSEVLPLFRNYLHEAPATLHSFMHLLSTAQLGSLFQWIDQFGDVCIKIKN